VKVGQTYYAYATNAAGINVQSATSSDLTHWNVSSADVLPQLPAWALPGKTWAPDVSEVSPGHFVLYFVAASADPPLQCIGVATSASAGGPFVPVGDLPMVCQEHEGGSIDPSSFVDEDGTRYLLWKNDGNCCGLDTWLQLAQLSPDGQRLEGPTTKLIKQTEGWEGNVVEAPILRRHGEKYVLFYSANDYSGGKYAIGYARASAITGPYTKHKGPLFSTELSHDRYLGPGGQDVVIAPGGTDHIVFHSWSLTDDFRGMNVLPLTWHGDRPEVIMPER
jgi:arabinan endo-1,5-alpha-L-arabinosidase